MSESPLKFSGASGRKPQTEARQYVLRCLATILAHDIENADWLNDDLDHEPDRRRALKAARSVHRMLRRLGGPSTVSTAPVHGKEGA